MLNSIIVTARTRNEALALLLLCMGKAHWQHCDFTSFLALARSGVGVVTNIKNILNGNALKPP